MSTPRRRPSASFCVAILALLVVTGSTSYAAGLARNSVGTAQLRNGAVTSAKIKDRTVTGADVKDRSLGVADLAAGVVPPAPVVVSRDLAVGSGQVVLLTLAGVQFTGECLSSGQVIVQMSEPSSGFTLESTGTRATITNAQSTATVTLVHLVSGGALAASASAPSGGTATASYVGTIRNGTQRLLAVDVRGFADLTGTTATCDADLVVTPTS